MALLAGTAIVGLATAGLKAYQGYKQKKAAEKALAGLKQPEYIIPQELYDNLTDAEKRQVEGLPAEQKAEFVKNIARSQQQALQESADKKGGLLGIQQSANQQTDAYNNLIQMDAAARKESELQKRADIERARTQIAVAKDNRFNVAEGRYQEGLASAQGNIGAGTQNIYGAFSTLGSTALGVAGMKYQAGGGGGNAGVPQRNINTQGSTTPMRGF